MECSVRGYEALCNSDTKEYSDAGLKIKLCRLLSLA